MPLHLRERLRSARSFYLGFAAGFVLGAAVMASPALAVVAAAFLSFDLIRRMI